jgi:ubiquinone/menaquinone biosynthesis C-methylase UbiE
MTITVLAEEASTRTMHRLTFTSRHARTHAYAPTRQLLALRSISAGVSASSHNAMTGSNYEDYSKTSQTYDRFREPISLPLMRRTFGHVATRMSKNGASDLDLLDAGCGSGNYLHSLRKDVGTITGLEFNEGMLSKAREKLPGARIEQGSITSLPFEESSFDVCITTQVLHHLERDADGTFANIALASKEVARCLRPGGAWIIQTSTPQQIIDGFWWAEIIPDAVTSVSTRFPTLQALEVICREAGFTDFSSEIPRETLVPLEQYLDICGPFNEAYRNSDSAWSLARPEELKFGLAWLRAKIDGSEGEQYLVEREAIRAEVGQTTTVVVCKDAV